ncbi:hypothetical protein QFZ81_003987 [Paenibacillus sp. V4I9]|nr:hypothetical protein [Paenibacillus sp. V4I9]
MKNNLSVIKRVPTIAEFIKLCCAVGWKDYMNFEVAEESLNQSFIWCNCPIPRRSSWNGQGNWRRENLFLHTRYSSLT